MSGPAAPASPARQMALPFVHRGGFGGDPFLAAPSNETALAFLAPGADSAWPQRRLLLWGGAGIGKTHLLHLWVARLRAGGADAALLEGSRAATLAPGEPFPAADALAIDDVDAIAGEAGERALLHAINRAAEARIAVLLASRVGPGSLDCGLPDLASRLRASLAVRLGTPEDALLDALLARLLAERQIAVPEAVARRLRLLLPREPDAIRDAVRLLDRLLLEGGGRPTLALAAQVAALLENGGDEASSRAVSPVEPGLL